MSEFTCNDSVCGARHFERVGLGARAILRRPVQHSGSNYGILKTMGVGDARSGRASFVFTSAANGNALAARIIRQATWIDRLKPLI
ncbi:hypothetical protein SKP52_15850 [Sphingopyxis fribergensis]|uniref:Uncharacterized protein n=1 Tax=Sphingopyxis fribergensis TaxID=1515612 RepID=A0A0A7PQ22_9SPHN|nr:hypothetical protein [Sphingopyxis fribergensis]AJA10047.1 hypothetical protein SKP52_15850 [Sphingopyxis fribergensis]